MADETAEIIEEEGGMKILDGNVKVNGNLEVQTQIQARELLLRENGKQILKTAGSSILFSKECDFNNPISVMGGTVIGKETTYNSPYVGSETIQAGKRFVLADSDFRINGNTSDNPRSIIADVFKMKLGTLVSDNVHSKTETTDSITAKNAKVTEELTANEIFADTIKTNKLFLENVSGLNLKAAEKLTTLDLVVGGSAKVERDVSILGRGLNGAALTVNGGQIVANKGVISNTRNNRFQCLEIVGSGTEHDQCLKVDRYVDTLFEGDVTIQNSRLILD